MNKNFYLKLFFVALLFNACSQEKTQSDKGQSLQKSGFEVISPEESGIDFRNDLEDNPLSDKNVLSYQHYFNGAGVGVADFNNDGLQDIFFAGNEVANQLYINKGDFKFEKLGEEAGINTGKVWASGVSIIDINNDGYQDIYVCQQGPYDPENRRNLFFWRICKIYKMIFFSRIKLTNNYSGGV